MTIFSCATTENSAAGSYISADFRESAVDFNLKDPNYRIVIDDYSIYNTANDNSAGVEKLKNDIISGYRPDIPGGYLKAGKTDGKLFELPLTITAGTFAVKGYEGDKWTLREFLDYAETGEAVLNSSSRGDPVITLYLMLACSMEEFIDADRNVKFVGLPDETERKPDRISALSLDFCIELC